MNITQHAIEKARENIGHYLQYGTTSEIEYQERIKELDQLITDTVKMVEEAERKSFDNILLSMSWQARNETSEAIRVLAEIREQLQALTPTKTDKTTEV